MGSQESDTTERLAQHSSVINYTQVNKRVIKNKLKLVLALGSRWVSRVLG